MTTAGTDALTARVRDELARRLGEHVGRLGWSRQESARQQRDRLRVLLAHAVERSPFHARRLRGPPPRHAVHRARRRRLPLHSSGFGAATSSGPVHLVSVPATMSLDESVYRLNALNPPVPMGYASRLAQLAAERHAGRLRITPRAVTATSEMLTERIDRPSPRPSASP